jgi:hypothetical protein
MVSGSCTRALFVLAILVVCVTGPWRCICPPKLIFGSVTRARCDWNAFTAVSLFISTKSLPVAHGTSSHLQNPPESPYISLFPHELFPSTNQTSPALSKATPPHSIDAKFQRCRIFHSFGILTPSLGMRKMSDRPHPVGFVLRKMAFLLLNTAFKSDCWTSWRKVGWAEQGIVRIIV